MLQLQAFYPSTLFSAPYGFLLPRSSHGGNGDAAGGGIHHTPSETLGNFVRPFPDFSVELTDMPVGELRTLEMI